MGLIYDATCSENGEVKVTMTLSTRACPLHQMILQWVEEAILRDLEGIAKVDIELIWEPAWNISMAEASVQAALGGVS